MIVLKASVDGIQSLKDKTIKLTFSTQELPPNDAGILFSLQNELVGLGIARNDLSSDDVELLRGSKFDVESIPNQKSQSQRIRSILFILWGQNNEGFDQFTDYYNHKTNLFIEHLKSKIEQ